jgi:hypothetical protein
MAQRDHPVRQQTERPTSPAHGRTPARQSDQVGLLLAIEHSRTSRQGTADEGAVEPTFDEGTADAVDGDRSDVQGATDLLVGPCRAEAATIRLQQDPRPGQLACRRLAFGDERFQFTAFHLRQPHDEFLVHKVTPVRWRLGVANIGQKSEELINTPLTRH